MAHSPLLRTLMRLKLDRRSEALVEYEVKLEDISTILQGPPSRENFDDSRWTDIRKAYENKKEREKQHKIREEWYIETITKKRKFLDSAENKQLRYINFFRAWEDIIPNKPRRLRSAVAQSGFSEWRAPVPSDSLRFEQGPPSSLTHGRVCVGSIGILDRRLLHHALSPQYVPKVHFKMQRKELAGKSAEFAAFVEQQTSLGPKHSLIPRPGDESSDEGLLSSNEPEAPARGGKRKRPTTEKAKKRTRKPPSFKKLYDCKAHDRTQLNSQAINWFSLMQQRQPRVESPALERATRYKMAAGSYSTEPRIELDADEDPDEDPNVRTLRVHGILLPVQLPPSEDADKKEKDLQLIIEDLQLTIEDAARYRDWRFRARSFFNERDRYIQNRAYCERVQSQKLLKAVKDILGFWNKVAAGPQQNKRLV
ncbi:hypothetical protein Hte_000755 [Hypoxylon texense]